MMNKLLLAVAALLASGAALAFDPLDDADMSPMAEDQCSRYGDCGVTNLPPPPPPPKPRQ